jgi:hypothetical protein
VAPPLSLMPSFPPPPFSWPGVVRRCPRGESFLRIFTHRFCVAQGAEERGWARAQRDGDARRQVRCPLSCTTSHLVTFLFSMWGFILRDFAFLFSFRIPVWCLIRVLHPWNAARRSPSPRGNSVRARNALAARRLGIWLRWADPRVFSSLAVVLDVLGFSCTNPYLRNGWLYWLLFDASMHIFLGS